MGIWVISLTISLVKVRSCISIDRRKFRSQNSDSMDRWKAEVGIHGGKSQQREEKRSEEKKREDQRREGVRRKKIQASRKGRKVAKHCVFPMICGSGGSKSRLAKAAGEPSGQMRDEKIARRWWCEAHFQVKVYKTHHVPTTFGSWDVEKVHAVVARSTFRSQKWEKLRGSEHFWTFRCRFAWRGRHKGFFTLAKNEQNMGHHCDIGASTSRSSTLSTSFPDFSTLFAPAVFPAQVFQLQHSLFQDSSYFHIHLQTRDYGGSIAFHLLPLLLLGFARTIHYSPWLCCTDGASAGSTFSFLDSFWPTRSTSKISSKFSGDLLLLQCLLQDFVPVHIRLHAQDYGGESCTSSPTTPSPFLPERFYSPWMSGPTTVLLTWPVNSIKDQLKLAGAARGVPGGHGQQNFFHYWMPTYYSPKRD